MKIFYTKKDRELVGKLRQENDTLKKKIQNKEFRYLKEKEEADKICMREIAENEIKIQELEELNHKYRQMIGRCAGLTKSNNALRKENEKLKAEKPKVTRIKKCTGTKQKIGARNFSRQSNIMRKEQIKNER